MNKKAILTANVIYIIITVIFLGGLAASLWLVQNNAKFLGDYYSKELSRTINLAEPGEKITLDVHKATEVAQRNGIPFEEIFQFDNEQNRVCVKLSKGVKTCYSYFNSVDVKNPPQIQLASGPNGDKNMLIFETISKQKTALEAV
jgi:hypothetical protein